MTLNDLINKANLFLLTGQGKKENLILVHSFPTDSILLRSVKNYLNEFFNVYFIDLPGFKKNVPALFKISFKEYSKFVEKEIDKFKIEDYILAGISFGFYVVNDVNVDKKCKAIIAIEPYIGVEGLKINPIEQKLIDELLKDITDLNLAELIWKSVHLPKIFKLLSGRSASEIKTLISQIDANTFFKTAELIFETHELPKFKSLPYVLVINPNDQTVNSVFVFKTFKNNVKDLFVIETRVEHYPKKITVNYLQERIADLDVYKMIRWINQFRFLEKGVLRILFSVL